MDDKKWDFKQLGIGGGASALLLFFMQSQGVDMINKSQSAENQVIIEKTVANAQRIENLESNLRALNDKLEAGFASVRLQLDSKLDKFSQLFSTATLDKYTKTEHNSFASHVESRLNRIENEIRDINKTIYKYEGK